MQITTTTAWICKWACDVVRHSRARINYFPLKRVSTLATTVSIHPADRHTWAKHSYSEANELKIIRFLNDSVYLYVCRLYMSFLAWGKSGGENKQTIHKYSHEICVVLSSQYKRVQTHHTAFFCHFILFIFLSVSTIYDLWLRPFLIHFSSMNSEGLLGCVILINKGQSQVQLAELANGSHSQTAPETHPRKKRYADIHLFTLFTSSSFSLCCAFNNPNAFPPGK